MDIHIHTKIDLDTIRRECGDLDKLLISASDVKFNHLLGKGVYIPVYIAYHKSVCIANREGTGVSEQSQFNGHPKILLHPDVSSPILNIFTKMIYVLLIPIQ